MRHYQEAILVFDNARYHTTRELFKFLAGYEIDVQLLSAYSPELNAAEFIFAQLKRRVEAHLTLTS